jgi:cell division protein FtsZ
MMGTGVAEGDGRAMLAAQKAVSSPLLEDGSVTGARGVIINVTGGPDMSLMEVNEASCVIQEAAHEDANIIFGAVVDPHLDGKVKITVIATGFDKGPRTVQKTPTDMTQYTEHLTATARAAVERALEHPPAPQAAAAAPTVTVSRRQPIELNLTLGASGGGLASGLGAGTASSGEHDHHADSPYDYPAFLRRQS